MPLFWLSLAFLSGIFLGDLLNWPLWAWMIPVPVCVVVLALRSRLRQRIPFPEHPLPVPAALLLLLLALGGARYQLAHPPLTTRDIGWYRDQPGKYIVHGHLVKPPDRRDGYTLLTIEAQSARLPGELSHRPVRGLLLASVHGYARYGDKVRVEGSLQTPGGESNSSYREYLRRRGIHVYMPSAQVQVLRHGQGNPLLALIYAVRDSSLKAVYRVFPDPEASLAAGILLGVESGIPETVAEAFRSTGTAHVIAISGANFALIAGLLVAAGSRLLGKRRGALAAAAGIAFYAVLVGANPAVVRAALLSGLSLLASLVGRRQDGLNSLAFITALMSLFAPDTPWDIGFQLSFTATLGLILYAGPLTTWFSRTAGRFLPADWVRRLSGPVGEYFLFTLAAQVMTLPVTVYHFQRLSLSSVLANPLILPAQPPLMILGGLAVVIAQLAPGLGQLAAYLVWPFLVYTIRMVELCARAPISELAVTQIPFSWVALFYALLLGFTFLRTRLQQFSWLRPAVVLAGLSAITVVVWRCALCAPDGRLHLTVLPAGCGDAVLLQTPEGRWLLVDGGPSARSLSDALGRRLPLHHRRLDWLIVGGAQEEQIAGLPAALERFPPRQALWSGAPAGTPASRALQRSLGEAGVPVTLAESGQVLDLGQGAVLRVLSVSRRGLVALIEWGDFRALLPFGMDFETLDILQADSSLAGISVFLLADAGYAPVNPPEWIEKLHPQVVLLSVEPGRDTDRPSPETLQALQGYPLYRTDQNGWIEITTDGKQMWMAVEKQ